MDVSQTPPAVTGLTSSPRPFDESPDLADSVLEVRSSAVFDVQQAPFLEPSILEGDR